MFRSEEDLMVRAMLADMAPEFLSLALDLNDVDSSNAGEESLGLSRNYDLDHRALLVRFEFSTLVADGQSQLEVPVVVQTASQELVFRGGDEPVMYSLEWTALIDTSATNADERFGRYVVEA